VLTGGDGVPLPKAKEQLVQLFGGRALDPLKFLMGDAKEQRAIILAANPVQVTSEDLTRWTGDAKDWNVDGHGQEVLARVRKMYFDQRTDAGRVADQAKTALAIKQSEADALRVEKPEAMGPEAARTHVAAAERELAVLNDRRKQSEKRVQEAEGTRARVAEMRQQAEVLIAKSGAIAPSMADSVRAVEEHAAAMAAFDAAKIALEAASATLTILQAKEVTAKQLDHEAASVCTQANELEAAIAGEEDVAALAEQTVTAEAALEDAQALVTAAEATTKWLTAKADATAYEKSKAAADIEWERLNKIVKALTETAPAEITSRADLIEGLEVTPDAILLDGKDIRVLCGREKMSFAVTLAKRVAGKSKILTVDKMEQIAPENQREFVRMCLEGGWMLFAAVACDGPMKIVDAYQFAKGAA
jgi:hypothetical protein